MSLTLAQLKEELIELKKEVQKNYITETGDVKTINNWIRHLENAGPSEREQNNAKNFVLAELGMFFQEGVAKSQYRYSPNPTEDFILKGLNKKPNDYTFYRGIGVILKSEYPNEDPNNIYKSITDTRPKENTKPEENNKLEENKKKELLLSLENLKLRCEGNYREKLLHLPGEKKLHTDQIDQLNKWIESLNEGKRSEVIIKDLKDFFSDAVNITWKEDEKRFFSDLNNKPNDYTFYRGIGLILDVAELQGPSKSFKR